VDNKSLKDAVVQAVGPASLPGLEKVLGLVGDVPLVSYDTLGINEKLGAEAIVLGHNLSMAQVYKAFAENQVGHVVQMGRKDVLFELLLSGLLSRQAKDLIRSDSTFLLQKFGAKKTDSFQSLEIAFNNSGDKPQHLRKVEQFLEKEEKLRNLIPKMLQIVDELIMNAMYDAPVGTGGVRVFANTPRRYPVQYPNGKTSAKLKIHYDESRLLVGCEDPWGSFDEEKLRGHLAAVTKDDPSESTPAGQGAGLGLKMIIENSTSLYILVRKKELSAVYCGLDLSVSLRRLEQTPKHAHIVFVG
jgi:hypothetical protein